MSDDLLRRFRDKIRSKPARRRGNGSPDHSADEAPVDSIRIVSLQHGPYPEAARFNARFVPGLPRIRMTLAIGAQLRGRRPLLSEDEWGPLLGLCPRLKEHHCDGGRSIHATQGDAEDDGLSLAHLIEHVAIELMVASGGGSRCSGATCAHAGRADRFDLFLECPEPMLGRTVAILAAAAVRDLCAGRDRLTLHRRCRDLLASMGGGDRSRATPEDIGMLLGWRTDEAIEALQALARLGYLEAVSAAYTFSSPSGILFRRARLDPPARTPLLESDPPAAPAR